MIHLLLVIAAIVFIVWLVFTLIGAVGGGLIHLLWILILVCLGIWVFRYLTGGRRRSTL